MFADAYGEAGHIGALGVLVTGSVWAQHGI